MNRVCGPLAVVSLATVSLLAVGACTRAHRPGQPSPLEPGATLWERPADLATRDLYFGPWGREFAPDGADTYRLVERKHRGTNPGMTVVDSRGRQWSVKQPFPGGIDDESKVEVVLSRMLSAAGYHQPPVYHLRSFMLQDDWGTHAEPGGRFRPKIPNLKSVGSWRWEENPFVGSSPYQGLLVMLMMFNDSDLKNSNNTLYERRVGGRVERWYVVRDIGAALGDFNRWAPRKGDAEAFERTPFILTVNHPRVELNVGPWYTPLVRERITVDDVRWTTDLLAQLTDRQWRDAFRAGNYEPAVAERFIRRLQEKIKDGRTLASRTAN